MWFNFGSWPNAYSKAYEIIMNELLEELDTNTEWLETTEGDEIECISIENLKGILKKYKVELIK